MLIDIDAIKVLLPVSRTTIYTLMKTHHFPPPVKILRRSLWRKDQVEAWIRSQAGAGA